MRYYASLSSPRTAMQSGMLLYSTTHVQRWSASIAYASTGGHLVVSRASCIDETQMRVTTFDVLPVRQYQAYIHEAGTREGVWTEPIDHVHYCCRCPRHLVLRVFNKTFLQGASRVTTTRELRTTTEASPESSIDMIDESTE